MKKEEAGMYSGVENEGSSEKLSEQYPGIITLRELPEDKQKIVRKDLRMFGEDIYRLHLELVTDWEPEAVWGRYEESAEYYRDVLKKYGEVRYGDTITRDILVPGGLPLYALHYVIQRLFGWENSHLHRFELPEERVLKLSDGKREKLAELIGLVFRSPWMEEEEEFWADDYEGGSFLAWLRKKYTGPCLSLCHGESYFQCRKDVEQYLAGSYTDKKRGWREMVADMKVLERLPVEVVLCFGDRRCPGQGYEKLAEGDRILAVEDENPTDGDGKLAEGDELPECFADFMDEEMLDEIRDVKNGPDEPNNQPIIGCVTKELLYFYDFGDGWNVRITGSLGCEDSIYLIARV